MITAKEAKENVLNMQNKNKQDFIHKYSEELDEISYTINNLSQSGIRSLDTTVRIDNPTIMWSIMADAGYECHIEKIDTSTYGISLKW